MKPQTIVQVDAFTDRMYAGNPAAVCVLDAPRSAQWMQNVAMEMNLSETAFLHPQNGGYQLRWFSPAVEIDLCGHATLASAHVLWQDGHLPEHQTAEFYTRSGVLRASRDGEWITLDFPAVRVTPAEAPAGLLEGLNVSALAVARNRFDYLVEVEHADQVRSLKPNFSELERVQMRGVIVTARSDDPSFDFISRFFAPAAGVNEDPVTGSAHCALAPYWGEKLGKTDMTALQASRRSGVVRTQLHGERVWLSGHAITVLRGELLDSGD
jgi:PhzF family phenazine biosynthesis protein